MSNNGIKTNKKFNYRAILGEANPLTRFPLLYECAVDEFSQKPYDDASLNEILKNASMSKSSLYHHFGDKFGLYLATVDKIYHKKLAFFLPRMREGMKDGDFFKSIRELSQITMEFMFEDERLYHFSNQTLDFSHDMMEILNEYFPFDYIDAFSGFIQKSIDEGQIDPKYSPEFLANLLQLLLTNIDKLVSSSKPENALETLNLIYEILENGCANKE